MLSAWIKRLRHCVRMASPVKSLLQTTDRPTDLRPLRLSMALAWCRCLVVKRGAGGAIVADQAGRTAVTDGIGPVSVRDRTGAGDAFAGALIAALHQGAFTGIGQHL